MSFVSRAVSITAVSTFGFALLGMTSPGAAQENAQARITAINALTLPQVPMTQTGPDTIPAAQSVDDSAPQLRPAILTDGDDSVTAPADEPAAQNFATLAAAVAAQDHAVEEDRELRCLASGVYHESNGEPLAGQLAVAQTIVNRAQSGRFPKSICGVLTQRGQFSFIRGGAVPMPTAARGWKTAVAVAKVAYRDLWKDLAPDALFFHARRVSPGWRLARVATIGNHVFYR